MSCRDSGPISFWRADSSAGGETTGRCYWYTSLSRVRRTESQRLIREHESPKSLVTGLNADPHAVEVVVGRYVTQIFLEEMCLAPAMFGSGSSAGAGGAVVEMALGAAGVRRPEDGIALIRTASMLAVWLLKNCWCQRRDSNREVVSR